MKAEAPSKPESGLSALGRLSEELRQLASRGADDERRSDKGQFFTPWGTAQLMARMSSVKRPTMRLLDAGAGTGALTAAWLSEVCARENRPKRVEVVAYEIDEALIPYLRTMLNACRVACLEVGVEVTTQIVTSDFLEDGAHVVARLADEPDMRFDAAILNPPYRKIRSDSQHRALLRSVGVETSNLYTAFISLVLPMLRPGAELITITPRSFCNGPYFRPFRREMLRALSLKRIHVFEARNEAFREDAVLQENIILQGVRAWDQDASVLVSSSRSADDPEVVSRQVPFEQVVRPNDAEAFIHVVPDEWGGEVSVRFASLPCRLDDLELSVSTGRVVDFRAVDFLCAESEETAAPLIYPRHFDNGFISWPRPHPKKREAIRVTGQSRDLLVESGVYVLVKRFSAKEERRRVVAAVFDPVKIPSPLLGFENHLNYFHQDGKPLPKPLAIGLTAYLNSTLLDSYFRQFSGHTQVNATDLRNMRYPRRTALEELGRQFEAGFPEQSELDRIVDALAINGHTEIRVEAGELFNQPSALSP